MPLPNHLELKAKILEQDNQVMILEFGDPKYKDSMVVTIPNKYLIIEDLPDGGVIAHVREDFFLETSQILFDSLTLLI